MTFGGNVHCACMQLRLPFMNRTKAFHLFFFYFSFCWTIADVMEKSLWLRENSICIFIQANMVGVAHTVEKFSWWVCFDRHVSLRTRMTPTWKCEQNIEWERGSAHKQSLFWGRRSWVGNYLTAHWNHQTNTRPERYLKSRRNSRELESALDSINCLYDICLIRFECALTF